MGGVASAKVVHGAGRAPGVGGLDGERPHRAVAALGHAGGRGRRELVEARAVHDPGAPDAEPAEAARHELGQLRARDAHHLRLGQRGVGERAEQVEDGAHAELAARHGGVPRGGVERGREQEGPARLVEAALDRLQRRVDAHPELLEHVGAAAAAAHRAVAVFGHGHAAAGDHQRGDGGDVEGPGAVAARPAGVDGARRPQRQPAAAHRAREADDLVLGLAAHRHRRQQPADLRRRRLAVHDGAHGFARLVLGQAMRRPTTRPRWRFRMALIGVGLPRNSAAGRGRRG